MSRHGYTDDWDGDESSVLQQGRWQAQLNSAIRGKRGQVFLRALVEALDSMPEKSLASNSLQTDDGSVCTLGALARHRAVDVKTLALGGDPDSEWDEDWEDSDWDALAALFDIAPQLAREVMYENDETFVGAVGPLTPGEQRWQRMRAWVAKKIIPTEAELAAAGEAGA
jgi:hypothetical protein